MTTNQGTFWRDASDRLTFAIFDLDSACYPEFCQKLVEKFSLIPSSELIVGLDVMFRDYTDGVLTVGLEWDIWSGFIVTAKQKDAELLVRNIAIFLSEIQ